VCVCVCVCVCEGIDIDVDNVYFFIYVCIQEMDASEQARLLQRMLDSKDKALIQHAGMCPLRCMSASVASSGCVLARVVRLCVGAASLYSSGLSLHICLYISGLHRSSSHIDSCEETRVGNAQLLDEELKTLQAHEKSMSEELLTLRRDNQRL